MHHRQSNTTKQHDTVLLLSVPHRHVISRLRQVSPPRIRLVFSPPSVSDTPSPILPTQPDLPPRASPVRASFDFPSQHQSTHSNATSHSTSQLHPMRHRTPLRLPPDYASPPTSTPEGIMKPDPYENEPTAPVDPETSRLYFEACNAAKSWQNEADRLRKMIDQQIGDAHAGLVDGRKLYTHRPEERYAIARLLKENPELTQHYYHQVSKDEFNFELFQKAHPEIVEQYQVRSFRSLGDI